MGASTVGFGKMSQDLDKMMKGRQSRIDKFKVEVAEHGKSVALGLAPEDSGELKGSIEVIDGDLVVGAEHADEVEYGTFKSPAQPYFRPAVDSMGEYIKDNIGGVFNDTK